MIVKVQLPLASNEAQPPALVYDEKRSFQAMVPVTKEIKDAMKGKPKAFFHAHRENDKVMLDQPAPWQNW
jgi:hypothetical protein